MSIPAKKIYTYLFFPTNGSGLGHLTRCLAYARRLEHAGSSSFFTLSSAVEYIEEMGFASDYFISPFWSSNSTYDWNAELAVRFGMMLERVQPRVVIFDGTWPFQGFLAACRAYARPLKLVWSNRGLLKQNAKTVTVDASQFDLIIQPGEIGAEFVQPEIPSRGRNIMVPPVALLDAHELLDRAEARRQLHLTPQGRYALISLGSGNLKDIRETGDSLISRLRAQGFTVLWACPPIAVKDATLPPAVMPISVFPLVRYLRAFDLFVGAAGYNSCCEVVQAQIPALLIPNTLLADDQFRRAGMVAQHAPVVVSACQTPQECDVAVAELLAKAQGHEPCPCLLPMNGADWAAQAIIDVARCAS